MHKGSIVTLPLRIATEVCYCISVVSCGLTVYVSLNYNKHVCL